MLSWLGSPFSSEADTSTENSAAEALLASNAGAASVARSDNKPQQARPNISPEELRQALEVEKKLMHAVQKSNVDAVKRNHQLMFLKCLRFYYGLQHAENRHDIQTRM